MSEAEEKSLCEEGLNKIMETHLNSVKPDIEFNFECIECGKFKSRKFFYIDVKGIQSSTQNDEELDESEHHNMISGMTCLRCVHKDLEPAGGWS